MRKGKIFRRGERGQTILIVAVALVSLLAMAALAIDVVTLYVARNEIQRAADAAALAGAKGIADSGITTLQTTDGNYAAAEILAQNMATAAITAMVQTNLVAGTAPTVSNSPAPVYTNPNNPYITVSLVQHNLPTFFARIWGAGASTVVASATAEVYNPSNPPSPYTRIAPSSVKPWLVANKDPITGNVFVTTASGLIESGVIGRSFDLQADCGASIGCTVPHVFGTNPGGALDYVPAVTVLNSSNVCPTSCVGGTAYEESIECADVAQYSCGGLVANASWDNTLNPTASSAIATECLIHATGGSGPTQGQDYLAPILPGFSGPPQISQGGLGGILVTTSNSIVTIPIIDATTFNKLVATVTVVGFIQAFVNQVESSTSNINITILNIAGCGTAQNGSNPVIGGSGTSPVPVRLITPP